MVGADPIDKFFGSNTPSTFANHFNTYGFNTFQMAFTYNPGISSPSGAYPLNMIAGECRVATLIDWAFKNVQNSSTSSGFCAMAFSEGGCMVGGALSFYGMSSEIDYYLGATTPVCGDIGQGCNCTGACLNAVCPGDNASYAFSGTDEAFERSQMALWTGATTCQNPPYSPPSSDPYYASEEASSLATAPGGNYTFPQTAVHLYECYQSNSEPPQGAFWYNKLRVLGGPPTVTCYGAPPCDGEEPWTTDGTTPNAEYAEIRKDMETNCVPNH